VRRCLAKAMILQLLFGYFLRQLYGDNNESLVNVIVLKPNKVVDMGAYKAEIAQKLRDYRGERVKWIFLHKCVSGFTDLIDGLY
jgi:putative ABC transport system permease protein